MHRFKITLNFTFRRHSLKDVLYPYDSDDEDNEECVDAFQRTDAYYLKYSLEDYVKTSDPEGFVEYMLRNAYVESAEWDPEAFQIHMVVETEDSKESILEELQTLSLEDGQYEASGESAWVLFTRGPNGEICWDIGTEEDAWPYGEVDYRQNPIHIELLKKRQKN